MHRWADLLPKSVLACALLLALPGTALAAPAAVTGPATIGEDASKADFTIACGTTGLPGDLPDTGTLTVTVAPGPAPPATKDADYQDPDPLTTTIVCPAQTGATVSVPILNDPTDEPGEKFTVTAAGTLLGQGAVSTSFTTTITDDDVPEATITPLVSVLEGVAAAELTVTLSQTPVEPATVSFATENSSAAAGSDYTATSGQLTIPAGQTTGKISIPILDDAAPESPEGFYVNLSSPLNATLNVSKKQGVVAIFDKDTAPLPVFSLPQGVAVKEGNSGTVNVLFPVTLSIAPTERVSVDWRTGPFTANLADYEGANGTITFDAGQTTKTISVNVKGDLRDEPAEAFGVLLGNPQGGTIGNGKAFGVITDDDGPKVGIGRPVVRGKSLVMVLTCPKTADRCRGQLDASLGKIKAGKARFDLAKGGGRELKLKLSRKARKALAKRARRMRFAATAADASGAQRVTTKRFRVRRIR